MSNIHNTYSYIYIYILCMCMYTNIYVLNMSISQGYPLSMFVDNIHVHIYTEIIGYPFPLSTNYWAGRTCPVIPHTDMVRGLEMCEITWDWVISHQKMEIEVIKLVILPKLRISPPEKGFRLHRKQGSWIDGRLPTKSGIIRRTLAVPLVPRYELTIKKHTCQAKTKGNGVSKTGSDLWNYDSTSNN